MTTHSIIAPFWKRRWLILTTTLAVIIGALLWAQQLPHVYESSVVLAPNSQDNRSIPPGEIARLHRELWSASVINPVTESEFLKDSRAAGATTEQLVERLWSSTALLEDHQGVSAVVRLYYRDRSPETAQALANLLGQTLYSAELRNRSENGIAFKVVQPASPAVGPIKPRMRIIGIKALSGGLLLGLVLAGFSELLSFRKQGKLGSPSMRAT